ncbi:hypothetical protein JW979_03540, partial [bacterium]|nr:hypothetical protein [candidate division CSSED10-310 bacterium]
MLKKICVAIIVFLVIVLLGASQWMLAHPHEAGTFFTEIFGIFGQSIALLLSDDLPFGSVAGVFVYLISALGAAALLKQFTGLKT